MNRALFPTAGTIAVLALVVPCHSGCESAPYSGGRCEAFEDCHSTSQNVPGTICRDGSCECEDPRLVICCTGAEKEPGCLFACRSCDKCNRDTLSAIDVQKCPLPECESDAGCPGAPDPRCGTGRCADGRCTLEIKPGPLASQPRGDCAHLECTEAGEVISVEDQFDTYDDGKQCTLDLCDHGTPINTPLLSAVCPVTGEGRCYEGECVECVDSDPTAFCSAGRACDGVLCVPPHCVDNDFDPRDGETAKNCGGPCRPCDVGEHCITGPDCESGACERGVCKLPTCKDGVKNGAESGVDCGAPSCPRCGEGEGCETGDNCASGVCWAGLCDAMRFHSSAVHRQR